LLALTFVRPGELRAAEWADFDLDASIWSIPAQKMKMRRAHRVPLAPQIAAILHDLKAISVGSRFLFPSVRSADRCMSENTINAALRRLGFEKDVMTAHGGFHSARLLCSTRAAFGMPMLSSASSRMSITIAFAAPMLGQTFGKSMSA
jgi:integrase